MVLYNTQVESVAGDSTSLLRTRIQDGSEKTTFAPEDGDSIGVFVFGYAPETNLVKELTQTDDHGYLITTYQETTCEGLCAVDEAIASRLTLSVRRQPLLLIQRYSGETGFCSTDERHAHRPSEAPEAPARVPLTPRSSPMI